MTRRTGGASERRSALYVGDVRHRRHRPRGNAFRYGSYWTLIDVDELAALDREVRGFGYGRRAVTSFRDTDHLGPADVPVRAKLARWLADRGVTLPAGRVQVLTSLRVLGHVFNPVSWWFCSDADGRVVLVVAEVRNTFDESHRYLLEHVEHRGDGTLRASAPKVFHVSPFLPVDGHTYDFVFAPPGDRVLAHIDVTDASGRILDATQTGDRVELTGANLARTLLRYPLVTLRTVFLIHRQAVTLWRLRTPFFRKPEPPVDASLPLVHDRTAVSPAIPTAPVTEPERTSKELAS
ncbi:MAG: DUF1365 domain-containing protein [Nitriliruptor sp.]|uniref:DUF1365 domain-containing protein n=1 Tax=Nitriliruptor sp. TaxID=2448056 RepID=UPI0034A06F3E